MGRGQAKQGKAHSENNTSGLTYLFDEKQFWAAYRDRKGYIISKAESRITKMFEDMMLFMTDLLPLNYAEIAAFPYQQFFRTLKTAQTEAKRREQQSNNARQKIRR